MAGARHCTTKLLVPLAAAHSFFGLALTMLDADGVLGISQSFFEAALLDPLLKLSERSVAYPAMRFSFIG